MLTDCGYQKVVCLLKIFLIIKSVDENKSIVLSLTSKENWKILKYHTLGIIIHEKLCLINVVVIMIQYLKKKNSSRYWEFLAQL